MRQLTIFGLVLLILAGLMLTGSSGCSADIDVTALKESVFKGMISLAMTAVEKEFQENKALNWMTKRLTDIWGDFLDDIPGWKAAVKLAYDVVIKNAHEILKDKLELPGYEGADPFINSTLQPSDFDAYYDEVMAPVRV